ncbi:MAG: hypothetical protein M3Q99_04050 [Acidobacteriota bacterium]|nr:hypothetical protein [Acidobacteriota bacterium]
MEVFHARIEADGRIQLPPQILEELDFETGQDLDLQIEKNALRISPTKTEQRKQAQSFVRSRINTNNSNVDEFIEERRREAVND